MPIGILLRLLASLGHGGGNLDKGQLEVHLEGDGGREGEDFISRDRKRSGGSSGTPGTAWYGA